MNISNILLEKIWKKIKKIKGENNMFAKRVQSCKFKDVKFVDGELVFQNKYNLSLSVVNNINKNHILYTRVAFVIAYSLFLSSNPSLVFANPCTWIENMGDGAISAIQATGIKILTGGMIIELIRRSC